MGGFVTSCWYWYLCAKRAVFSDFIVCKSSHYMLLCDKLEPIINDFVRSGCRKTIEQFLHCDSLKLSPVIIGAGEVFHYFMITSKRIPFFTALSWGLTFIIYYGILLCCSHLYGVTLSISYAFFLPKDAVIFGSNTPISYLIIHVSLFLLYFNSL